MGHAKIEELQRTCDGLSEAIKNLEGFEPGDPISKGPHVDFECEVIFLADQCFTSLKRLATSLNTESWRWLIPRFLKTHIRFPLKVWKAARTIGGKTVLGSLTWTLLTLAFYPQYLIMEILVGRRFEAVQPWIYPWNYWISVKILLDSKRKR